MAVVKTLTCWDTVHSADSVEWCPLAPCQEYLVCGTYQLKVAEEGQKQKKVGRLYLLKYSGDQKVQLHQMIEMPAVLDSKWCHKKINGKILLCVANEAGHTTLFELSSELDDNTGRYQLRELSDIGICDALALSLDWSTGQSAENIRVCVSDSKGSVTVVQLTESELGVLQQWKAHQAEAWIAAFDYWNTDIVYTGGDDSEFHTFDLRCGTSKPSATSTSHKAGVTSLHCNAMRQGYLASGSYDEMLRLWDTRNTRQPVCTLPVGGGVWRVKWDPQRGNHLIAACIYGGFWIVCDEGGCLRACGEYRGRHSSLAYGADWSCLAGVDGEPLLVGTCSFYDHLLSIAAVALQAA